MSAGTTNASLKTDAVEAPEADFTTQSGSVRLENSRFAARVSVRTTNAGIRVDQLASRISGCPAPTVPSKAPSPAASRIIPS